MSQFNVGSNSRFPIIRGVVPRDDFAAAMQFSARPQPQLDPSRQRINFALERAIERQAANDVVAAAQAFEDAAKMLRQLCTSEPSSDVIHLYGITVKSWAMLKHEQGDDKAALAGYSEAIDVLAPLEAQGDGEAKLDIASVRYQRGLIYHNLGELDKAAADFDASFAAFRVLEKISDVSDTRFSMAKVSEAQGNLARDCNELTSIIDDLYNRAMRLLIELIEGGQVALEHDLAVVLINRCAVRFDSHIAAGASPQNADIFDSILADTRQGIDILERLAISGDQRVVCDLFCAILTHGTMLIDLGHFDAAAAVLSPLLNRFLEVLASSDPAMMSRVASLHENLEIAICGRK